MSSGFQAAIGRIQEIEAKLGVFRAAPPPAPATPAPAVAAAPLPPGVSPDWAGPPSGTRLMPPFSVALAQANGQVRLQPLGPHAGPFTPQIEGLISKYSAANGLDSDVVRAVVQQESSGNPRETSGVGAQGLMQLMPETGRMYGVTDPYDPEQNIAAGTRHLANLMREFKNQLPMALAAYNAGSGAVRRAGGIPHYAETQDYVRKITAMVENAKGGQ